MNFYKQIGRNIVFFLTIFLPINTICVLTKLKIKEKEWGLLACETVYWQCI
jgi:hypothetical protein